MPGGVRDGTVFVDLRAAAGVSGGRIAWSHQSEDLNLNLIVLDVGQEIELHRNDEVDVLLVGVEGDGVVVVDSVEHRLGAGQVLLIPKGAQRAMRGDGSRFAYLTCHGLRRGIQPQLRGR